MKTPILAAMLAAFAVPALAATVDVPNPLGNGGAARRDPPPSRPAAPQPAARAAAPAPSAVAVFPKAIDPRYAKEGAGKARMQTCLDQYRANAASGNGGPKWIEKGGGYYSECNRRLKG